MAQRKSNLFDWLTQPKETYHRSKGKAAPTAAAYRAGIQSGDTGLFDSWMNAHGYEDFAPSVRDRMQAQYERGVERTGKDEQLKAARAEKKKAAAAKGYSKYWETYKGVKIFKVDQGYAVTSGGRRKIFSSQSDAESFIDSKRPRKNPEGSAAKLSESFHGRPAKEATEYVDTVHVHEVFADLGKAIRLCVLSNDGKELDIVFDGKTRVASNEDGDQYYFVAGDQSVDVDDFGVERIKESVVLGKAFGLVYYTTKHHLGDEGGKANYEHELGESEDLLGNRIPPKKRKGMPTVIYDTRNAELSLSGGTYHIDMTDVDGKYSAGIRD